MGNVVLCICQMTKKGGTLEANTRNIIEMTPIFFYAWSKSYCKLCVGVSVFFAYFYTFLFFNLYAITKSKLNLN